MSDLPENPLSGEEEFDPADIDDLDPVDDPEPDLDEGEEPEPDPDLDEGEEPEPRRERQGRETSAQRLRRQLRERDRELQELRTQVQQPPQPQRPAFDPAAAQRAEAEKWERRALMSPVELMQDVQRENEQRFGQAMLAQQVQIQDQIDKQAYEQAAVTSRVHRQYQDRVERLVQAERQRGNVGVNRVAILKYLIGEDAIARGNSAAPTQRRAAARRVAAQGARPTNARGDGARPSGSRDPDAADERLLRGIRAGDL